MAQPTRSDDQVVRRRLSHNNLRRKKWRRRQPRAERKRPRRSGRFSALTFGVLVEHPIFLSRFFPHRRKLLLARRAPRARVSPRSEVATTPGRRARRQSALAAGRPRNPPVKGGILNGEEGEGRKEEGGEEKVSSLLGEKGDASASPFFVRALTVATARSSRPRSARGESHPPVEYGPRARCRSRHVRTWCSGRQDAVAASV